MANVEHQFGRTSPALVAGRIVVVAGLLAGAALQGGCLTGSTGDRRLARYRPDAEPYRPESPKPAKPVAPPPRTGTAAASRPSKPRDPVAVAQTGNRQVPGLPAMPVIDEPPASAAAPSGAQAGPAEREDAAAGVKPAGEEARPPVAAGQRLKMGDEIVISLMGVIDAETTKDVIDEKGEIRLKWVGSVKIASLSTSEAEALIEKLYVDGGIYSQLTVAVVAQKEEYYVQGEIQRPGRFQLDKEITLMQAISAAGGFTPFAKKSKIEVRRGDLRNDYDWDRIVKNKDPDPQVRPGDIIHVPRKIFWD